MLGIKQDSIVDDHSPKTFVGVRFVLFGFDPIDAQKDDPLCVAARADGKILVTGLWVDHSFDIGMPVDSTSVMYRPLRDLNGIPGAKSLIVCLTGYQRQDRDDIMTMVDLMGAKFSKPLVANKVTHLVCYKFEGEKYELGKKMQTIKLVNHRWLEDCLRAWEILPEANYDTSGYELEMMEAEAKDSEEEEATENIAKRQYDVSPHNLHISTERAHPSPQSRESISRNLQAASASRGSPSAWNNNDTVLVTAKENAPVQDSNLQDNYKKHLEELGSPDTRTARGVTCHESSEQPLKTYNRTPTSEKVGNNLSSSLGSAMRSHSDVAKLSTKSYLRKTPRRNTLPVFSGEMASHLSSFSKLNVDKFNDKDGFHISSFRAEQAQDGTDSGFVKTPLEETEIRHEEGKSDNAPEKRKLDVSYGSSKSQKTSHDSEALVSPLVSNRNGGPEPAVLINGMLDDNAAPNPLQSSSAAKCSPFDRKSSPKPTVNAVISESRETNLEAYETSFTSADEPDAGDAVNRANNAVSDVGKPKEELQDAHVPSSRSKSSGVGKSNIPSLNLSEGENAPSLSKPLRKKVISRKSLGFGSKLSPSNAKNKKCSIYLNKAASESNVVISSISGKETVDREMLVNCETRTPTADVDKATLVETNNVAKSGNEVESKSGYMDDETEAPEDREEEEHELETGVGKEKSMEADQSNKMNIEKKDKSDHAQTTAVKNDFNILGICDPMKALDENENGAELEKAVCYSKNKANLSTSKEDSGKEKITKGKKRSLGKTLRKSVHSVMGIRKSMDCGNAEESQSEKNVKKTENKKENSIPHSVSESKKTVPVNKSENYTEAEKENRPVDSEDKSVGRDKQRTGKVASKLNKFPMKIDPKSGVSDLDSVLAKRVPKVKIEPAWFILSGHKLQRKEFQQVIRRLKGRICRDSHQWSYQATHFIVPDPIRRTEKFFAAAASGRWILKTDYLTASNQAGRFLAEEPYEWHKKGLSEDGAINLEAPRKWRLLRERTGHGAFYGMRVVVYGECIAPPLDTLKRVIKAGDGTILATSPPYTRFLKSGVDFAIISPGMPRVDVWVQEFLRHEIPCVVADYLVEYVCKPGYSLERHVQYNTHAWAERSISNLLSRSEEVIEEPKTPEDCVNNDLPCQVCGFRDRGDVMLICGDEGGSKGCGVGMHIDCCNPPVENVPEEDWFCPKCSESINNMKRPKGTKK